MLYQIALILNILTILLIAIGIVMIYNLSKKDNENSETSAHEVFEDTLRDPSNRIRHFYAEKKMGDIGSFTGSTSKFSETANVL